VNNFSIELFECKPLRAKIMERACVEGKKKALNQQKNARTPIARFVDADFSACLKCEGVNKKNQGGFCYGNRSGAMRGLSDPCGF